MTRPRTVLSCNECRTKKRYFRDWVYSTARVANVAARWSFVPSQALSFGARVDSRWTLKNRARGRLQTQIAFCVFVAISRFHNAQSPVYRCSFKDCIALLHSSNASAIDWYRFVISSICLMPPRSC